MPGVAQVYIIFQSHSYSHHLPAHGIMTLVEVPRAARGLNKLVYFTPGFRHLWPAYSGHMYERHYSNRRKFIYCLYSARLFISKHLLLNCFQNNQHWKPTSQDFQNVIPYRARTWYNAQCAQMCNVDSLIVMLSCINCRLKIKTATILFS